MAQQTRVAAALIGDLVASREAADRARLQQQMTAVFDVVSATVGGDPVFTLGDEFQARFDTLTAAIEASFQVHLRTIGLTRVRIGIGWGELLLEDPQRSPFGQDGPCWWRAREAIEVVDRSSRSRGPEARTALRSASGIDPMLNGYLLLRDTLLDGLDEMDARIAIGLIEGLSQTEIAARVGINKSSVNRRAHSHGILALIQARQLGSLPLEEEG
jgi:SatD family (SatD)